jgi:hypothetical protein
MNNGISSNFMVFQPSIIISIRFIINKLVDLLCFALAEKRAADSRPQNALFENGIFN